MTGANDDEPEFDPQWQSLISQLEILYRRRRHLEDDGAPRNKSLVYLWAVLRFTRNLLGEQAYNSAMGRYEGNDPLLVLANRVQAISPLMDGESPPGASFQDLVAEIFAVSGGDAPRLLAQRDKRQGKRGNAHRLAILKLDALMWNGVLERRGMETHERQNLICSRFASTWDAIKKWKAECIQKLGQAEYDRVMAVGLRADRPPWGDLLSDDDVIAAVTEAGHRFKAERRREKIG